jgi:dTDP-glucose 4,6-dehydratase
VNFAAETHVDNSIKDAIEFVKTNVEGVLSILNVCRDRNIELIHLSTDEVYGPASYVPFDEMTPLNPKNPYAATKAAADHLIISYVNTYGIKYKIVRPSNNFGPRQHDEKFIPKIVKSVKERNNIPVYGDGSQKRQWTYVKDTARIIYKIATECPDGIYNISDGNVVTNNDLVNQILSLMNCDSNLKTYVKDRPGHDKMYWITSRKINSLIEMEFTNFNTALKETVENS